MKIEKSINKSLILIVDDQRNNRQMIKLALESENYDFIEAQNGLKALELCKEYTPDIILMDAIMPVMDGFEAVKKLREIEKYKRTPILMISILSNKDDRIKAIEYGVNDFITKPFDKLELISRCKSYVNLANLNKKYILSSQNQYTKLPNKIALMEDLPNLENPNLILFRIEDYELIEEFYSDTIAQKIELEFSNMVYSCLKDECKNAKLYHILEGEFALLGDNSDKSKLKDNCLYFHKQVKNSIVKLTDIEYNLDIVLSYAYGTYRLFEHARMGLNYAIKTNQNVVSANEVMKKVHEESKQNMQVIKTIKNSIKNNKIVSHFQPIYNNKTKQIDSYESLVRIIDDTSILYPISFLGAAKSGKYSIQITKIVLDNSFEVLKNIQKDMNINLSTLDIESESIREYILEYLKQNKQYASRLCFELLEDDIHEFELIKSFINELKSLGVKIAIDDFGAGYSNFNRLLQFQPDILKIDGSLIKNIHKDEFSRNIVESIQKFASKNSLKTVAEYVENTEIFEIINEIGIDYTQGFYIGKAEKLV